jgi:hypothetical protein
MEYGFDFPGEKKYSGRERKRRGTDLGFLEYGFPIRILWNGVRICMDFHGISVWILWIGTDTDLSRV